MASPPFATDPLRVIAGPTASGKTAAAIELALELGAEIVSADSQQVYRFFDIGTAKPTAEELARVPHHLISVVDPHEAFSARRYQALADAAIEDLRRRGKPVVVVGGTGLYLRALLHGLVDAPAAEPALRARLEAEAEANGRPALHARLAELDPTAALAIHPSDLVRIIRALEIIELTGERASAQRARHAFAGDRHPYRLVVLRPPRELLYERINRRAREMFAAGLVEEVEALVARGFRHAAPMGSVGYAQALAVVEGQLSREEAIAQTAQESRRYAKRQLNWFRTARGASYQWPPNLEGLIAP